MYLRLKKKHFPLIKLQRIRNVGCRKRKGMILSGEGGQYASAEFTSQLHMKLQLLLFYPCYSTSSGETADYRRMFS